MLVEKAFVPSDKFYYTAVSAYVTSVPAGTSTSDQSLFFIQNVEAPGESNLFAAILEVPLTHTRFPPLSLASMQNP